MDHQRLVRLAIFADIFQREAARQGKVELHCGKLPGAADGVNQFHVDLGAAAACAVWGNRETNAPAPNASASMANVRMCFIQVSFARRLKRPVRAERRLDAAERDDGFDDLGTRHRGESLGHRGERELGCLQALGGDDSALDRTKRFSRVIRTA